MEGSIRKYLFIVTSVLLVPMVAPQWTVAADSLWIDLPTPVVPAQAKTQKLPDSRFLSVRRVVADNIRLQSELAKAPMERTQGPRSTLELPMPDGSLLLFNIEESPIMAADIAAKFPGFSSYRARAVDDPSISGRLDYSPGGFHGMIQTSEGTVFIDPASQAGQYNSYYKHDYIRDSAQVFSCGVTSANISQNSSPVFGFKTAARTTNELRTYRFAVAATVEYSNAVPVISGNPVTDAQTEIQTAINRVNDIFERDLAISLQLVVDIDLISTDSTELNNDDEIVLIDQVQGFVDTAVGVGAYDIGHVFSTGGGGLAGAGVVCDDSNKARGVTGSSAPIGDPFYIDFVAHEIGHQFSARHSFNGTDGSCSGGRNAATAYEPGSGTTIMAYAGLCNAEDVQSSSDATFHAGSIAQVLSFVVGGGSCVAPTATGNTAPTVNAGPNYTIPERTPFTLSGTATDPDLDALTYQWDEMDAGSATDATTYGTDLGDNALFRSFLPSASETRDFPQLATLLSGITDKAETLPTEKRSLNFRLTVRDGNGGVGEDDMRVNVADSPGPFAVTQPNNAVTLDTMQAQVIEWETACTDQVPVNCANVDILLDTGGADTFATTLLANTPNMTAATAVVKVACSDNIFFDISNTNIVLAQNSGIALNATGAVSKADCGPGVELLGAIEGDGSTSPAWLILMTGWLLYFRRQQKMNAARPNSKRA